MYSDGSVKKPKGDFCRTGGIGLWWPNGIRVEDELNENEGKFLQSEKNTKGLQCWNHLNCLRGNSTRTELGALMCGMIEN